jgi:hypothetical protein
MTSSEFAADDRSRPQAGASLDQRTFLVGGDGDYMVSVYPEAAECVIVACIGQAVPVVNQSDDDESVPELVPVERTAEEQAAIDRSNWERSNRRAVTESRRYFVANRLRYQWVLTYGGEGLHGPVGRNVCMHDVAAFARRFRHAFGDLPYWFSPELHPDGHGWHVNFYVAKRLSHAQMQELWGHGYVWVSDKTKHPAVLRQNLTFVEALRLGAMYACKYAVKDWAPESIGSGRHRYSCAENYRPVKGVYRCASLVDAVEFAEHVLRGSAASTWCSLDDPEWEGPPVWCLRWSTGVDPPKAWKVHNGQP